jgi:hypothetical protein
MGKRGTHLLKTESIAVARRALLAPVSALNCAWHKLSKVSALLYVACKGPIGTFENFYAVHSHDV